MTEPRAGTVNHKTPQALAKRSFFTVGIFSGQSCRKLVCKALKDKAIKHPMQFQRL